jgi:hypothetical protein
MLTHDVSNKSWFSARDYRVSSPATVSRLVLPLEGDAKGSFGLVRDQHDCTENYEDGFVSVSKERSGMFESVGREAHAKCQC